MPGTNEESPTREEDFIGRFLNPFDLILGPNPEAYLKDEGSSRAEQLRNRISRLRASANRKARRRQVAVFVGVLFGLSIPLYAYIAPDSRVKGMFIATFAVYSVGFLLVAWMQTTRQFQIEINIAEDELDLISDAEVTNEQRAQKLFNLHQHELDKYYDQTLKQSRWIFFVGIACLVLGFATILATLYFLAHEQVQDSKRITALLGGLGGLLANFIGAIYLKMHSETIRSLTEFHNRLVLTHYLHFGNFLLAKIENKDLREESLASMALSLANGQGSKHGPLTFAGVTTAKERSRKDKKQPAAS